MNRAGMRLASALLEVEAAQVALTRSAAPLGAAIRRRPATWLVGSGFVTGLVAGFLPVHRWLRAGAFLATTGLRLLSPFMMGADLARAAVNREI
ncbi:MAG: hypothetical protein ABI846_08050 [Rudaea sp.]